MRVPDEYRELLAPYFPDLSLWEVVDLQIVALPDGRVLVPHAVVRMPVMRAASLKAGHSLKTAGMTIGNTIYLDPAFAQLDTAAGLALLAHEREHVDQIRTIPNFQRLYDEAARATPPDHPWENPYEMSAYERERQVYCDLVSVGVPAGPWLPLGFQLWGC